MGKIEEIAEKAEQIYRAKNLSENNKHYEAAKIYKNLGKIEEAIIEALKATEKELYEQAREIYKMVGLKEKAKKIEKIAKSREEAYSNLY